MNEKIYIGISGYSYSDWHKEGGFYQNVKYKDELSFYAKNFKFVEINGSFYREPSTETLQKWKSLVPPEFMFTLKVHRYFTHMKRLNVDDQFKTRWKIFWQKCLLLKPKLGVILFQLPTLRLKKTQIPLMIERLHKLHKILPKRQKIVFECRDLAWDCEEVKSIFEKYNWCFCVIHVNNDSGWAGDLKSGFFPHERALWTTATWGAYFRFHGSKGKYIGKYDKQILKDIAQWAVSFYKPNRTIYIAFNNTDEFPPSAIDNAFEMQKIVKDLLS